MTKSETIKTQLKNLHLSALSANLDEVVTVAETQKLSYLELIRMLLEKEINHRKLTDMQKRTKQARLPLEFNLDHYDFSVPNGLEKQQLNQLRELSWLEQNFNIILMGPSGTGKTYIAAGLCFDAIDKGYRAYFKTMEELVKILKMKDHTRKAAVEYQRIMKSHLLVIDDIMMFPVTPQDALAFFNLINELHERVSLIITTNKSPKEWSQVLKDEVLTTALLDRILYHCEIVKLQGKSYRMENRKTIFKKKII
ncbi:MAG: IS21-like element helper ATPase IstB [Chitinophagales bacterium]|nr:IS21-like element helper ATPase IstB [Chitinophagales bacterium]